MRTLVYVSEAVFFLEEDAFSFEGSSETWSCCSSSSESIPLSLSLCSASTFFFDAALGLATLVAVAFGLVAALGFAGAFVLEPAFV